MLRCKCSLHKLERKKYFAANVDSAIKALECFSVMGPHTTLDMVHLEVSKRLRGHQSGLSHHPSMVSSRMCAVSQGP